MVIRESGLQCGPKYYKKNGLIKIGKQNHHCQDCGRQFVLDAENRLIPDDTRALIQRRLLPEWIS